MKKSSPILLYAVASLLWLAMGTQHVYPEYIFMKEGAIVQGAIIGDSKVSVIVKGKDNKISTIPRNKISRVIYADLYLGKLYVRLTDGNSFVGFMVDEDANNYTFRKVLENPQEFPVQRKDVLFTARRNPTHLQGKAGDDNVSLEWHAPYNKVRTYKIYQKAACDKEFKHTGATGGTSETVARLKSNSKYDFYVTAVDTEGEESLPSDIISIITKNRPPHRPDNLKVEKNLNKIQTKMNVRLTWDKVDDPDGKVEYYNVYLISDIGNKLQGKTVQTAYRIQDLNPQKNYRVIVRSVDNNGAESPDSSETIKGVPTPVLPPW